MGHKEGGLRSLVHVIGKAMSVGKKIPVNSFNFSPLVRSLSHCMYSLLAKYKM